MNNNRYSKVDNEIRAELMQYAVEKYGCKFEEVFYETAADATQNYVLCLRDEKGRVFNVYEDGKTGDRTDDYKNSIVNQKVYDYLKNYLSAECAAGEIAVKAIMNIAAEVDELEKMTAQECVDRFGLYSLVFVYHIDGAKGSIEANSVQIIEAYHKLRKFTGSSIDFNVVVTSGDAKNVKNVRMNMLHRYSRSWYVYEEVQEYIACGNPKLTDTESVLALIKE